MVLYFAAMLTIGFVYSKRSNSSTKQYFAGGRGVGPWLTALSAEASDMSGWLLMGLPGVAYFTGAADPMWTAIGLALGTYLNWKLVARRLRRYSVVAGDAITIPDFFSKRFHDDRNIVSTIAALIILVFFCVYVGSCFVTVGKLFSTLFGWDYHLTMVIGAAIVFAYTIIGGYLSVVVTDFIQGVRRRHRQHRRLPQGHSGIPRRHACGHADPQRRRRADRQGRTGHVRRARRLRHHHHHLHARVGPGLLRHAAGARAVPVHPQFRGNQEIPQAAAENIFIVVSQALLPSFMCGIVVSGIFAASMSSSSSYMIIGASAVGENIFRGLLHRKATDRQVMMVARITLLVMFIFGIVVAFDQNSSIFQVVSYAWAGLGASFGPLMLTSLYWRRTNKYGAIAGMLSGTATVLIWHNLVKPLGGIFAIYELLPAFIVSLLFIVVISLLTPAPSAEVLHEFDHYLDDPDDRHVDDDLVAAEIAAGEKRSQI